MVVNALKILCVILNFRLPVAAGHPIGAHRAIKTFSVKTIVALRGNHEGLFIVQQPEIFQKLVGQLGVAVTDYPKLLDLWPGCSEGIIMGSALNGNGVMLHQSALKRPKYDKVQDEPGTLRNLFEANAGVKISKKHELWIDGGLFGSHIGFESAVGKDCWTLTRSMLADNSPYYESGAKLSYTTPNGQWFFSALALNGWQRIQRVPGNALISGGTQIQFKPNAVVTLNSSSFFGTDKPDDARLWRAFHNFYGIFQFNPQFGLTMGFDTGWEENAREGEDPNFWYSPVLIARYAINDRLTLAGRVEYYSDENRVIIASGTENGFQTLGVSANLDVQIHKNAVWRLEGKLYNVPAISCGGEVGTATILPSGVTISYVYT